MSLRRCSTRKEQQIEAKKKIVAGFQKERLLLERKPEEEEG